MYFIKQAILTSLQDSDTSLKEVIFFPDWKHCHTENIGGKLESKH